MKMIENDRLYDKMDELLFWTRFSALPTFRAMIMDNLRTDIDKLVYELSDGKKSTRDISKIISKGGRKVTHATVANMWQRWNILNLVIPAQRIGRYKKVLSLESLGIEIPSTEISEEETS
jgi:hypothetical protein